MRRAIVSSILAISSSGLLLGCREDRTGAPLPDPIPRPGSMRATEAGPTVDLLGLPGAVPGAGLVTVQSAAGTFTTTSTPEGSFVLSVPTGGAARVEVQFENSPSTEFALPAGAIDPLTGVRFSSMGLERWPAVVELYPSAAPGTRLVAVNFNSGDVSQATADASGNATIAIEARPGDLIRIYATEGALLSTPVELVVSADN